MRWIEAARARLRLLSGRATESRMDHEIRFHLDMEADRLVREQGMSPEEAKRQAVLKFGGVDKIREELRDGRGLAWLSGLSLDFRLGVRMLIKYPGLTVIGTLAMAFAIFVGAVSFEVLSQVFAPSLPLPDADRVVGIRMQDAENGRTEGQVLHDLVRWQTELETVDHVGGFRGVGVNLITADGPGEPLNAAQMHASGFGAAGVAPLLGRALTAEDELPSAQPVVVIGYGVWQRRFNGDRGVVGRTVGLGSGQATVVGVMPEGFAFPIAHELWLPLRLNVNEYAVREGPSLTVFGRLAPGATLEEAQAELTVSSQGVAAESPGTHQPLRAEVKQYAGSLLNVALGVSGEIDLAKMSLLLRTGMNAPLVLFLLLVCGNIALLVFARAATRENEITVRTVLGASRRRVVAQLFIEALVLGVIALVIGLVVAGLGVRAAFWLIRTGMLDNASMPFWFHASLSPSTYLYAVLLTLVAAAVAGVLPALKVTRGLAMRLRQSSAGGGGFRFGGIWTAVVVSQIALTIPFPVVVLSLRAESEAIKAVDLGIEDERYLALRVGLDAERDIARAYKSDEERAAAIEATVQRLEQRLEADASVAGVTFAEFLPRMYHPYRLIELDEGEAAPLHPRWPGYRVSSIRVAPDFFDVLDVPILNGRNFTGADVTPGASAVIVNQSFVTRVLGGRNPIGRRLQYMGGEYGEADGGEPWYEIIGVVRDLGTSYGEYDPKISGIYHPVAPGTVFPLHAAVQARGTPAELAQRIRPLTASVDPAIRLYDIVQLDRVNEQEVGFYRLWFWVSLAGSAIALLLALAGIYAVMSFTVSQRTREIGIRVALGASHARIVREIFRRPMRQVVLGVLVGATVLTVLVSSEGLPSAKVIAFLVGDAVVMLLVCMLAWIVPTRRALRIEPQEALRAE